MVAEPLGGRRQVIVTDSYNRQEWATVVGRIIVEWYADTDGIALVQDNLSAHHKATLYKGFARRQVLAILSKLEFMYTLQTPLMAEGGRAGRPEPPS